MKPKKNWIFCEQRPNGNGEIWKLETVKKMDFWIENLLTMRGIKV